MSTLQRKSSPAAARSAPPRRRTRRQLDITGVALMAAAMLCAVSLAKPVLGGAVGEGLVAALRYLFGAGSWIAVILMAYLGVLHIMDREHKPPMDLVAGGGILTVVALWLVQAARVGMARELGAPESFSHGGGILGAAGVGAATGSGFGG
jgi:hypothetical protein